MRVGRDIGAGLARAARRRLDLAAERIRAYVDADVRTIACDIRDAEPIDRMADAV